MAFSTNLSAFGMKPSAPANTSTFGSFGAAKPAGQSSIFGATQQQPSTSGAFGTFGSQPQQSQNPAPAAGLFGGAFGNSQQQQPPQQPGATGAFGQPPGGQQSQGLFGSGAFGGGTGFSQNQPNQSAVQQPSIFSGLGANANSNQQQQQQPAQSGAFGAFGAPKLGSLQTQPNFLSGSGAIGGFGSSTSNVGTGSSLFAQPQQQQALSSSAVTQPAGPPPFTRTTKFNDLPDELKKILENIDAQIQSRVQISSELKQQKLGQEPVKGAEEIRSVHKELVHATNKLRADISSTRSLKSKMDQAVQDTIVATRIIDGFRNPQQHGAHLKNHVNFPLEYFTRVTDQLRERLQQFGQTVEHIERKITADASHVSVTPQAISATLQAQHASFIALANRTAIMDAELQKLKATYTQLWRAATGSARDPFNEHDRGNGDDFGLEGLHVK